MGHRSVKTAEIWQDPCDPEARLVVSPLYIANSDNFNRAILNQLENKTTYDLQLTSVYFLGNLLKRTL